jgi:hypothetical protein
VIVGVPKNALQQRIVAARRGGKSTCPSGWAQRRQTSASASNTRDPCQGARPTGAGQAAAQPAAHLAQPLAKLAPRQHATTISSPPTLSTLSRRRLLPCSAATARQAHNPVQRETFCDAECAHVEREQQAAPQPGGDDREPAAIARSNSAPPSAAASAGVSGLCTQ